MSDQKYQMFINRLTKVYKHRSKIARKQNISCYRLYDLDLPEFPLCIDVYGPYIHVSEYLRNHNLNEEEYDVWLNEAMQIIAQVSGTKLSNVYVKQRKKILNRNDQYDKLDNTKEEVTVQENGYHFLVNFNDFLDTGLFLDHRVTRKLVGDMSKDKRVLNLFAYTGSFSVYAAMNEAKSVHTMDLSNTYINWAKRNFLVNKLNPDLYEFSTVDVLAALPLMNESSFDLIICDPPTFSNSKKMDGTLDIQKHHVWIINQCLELLDDDGILIFSTNFSKFKIDAEAIHTNKIKDITRQTTPFDFEGKLNRYCFRIEKGS